MKNIIEQVIKKNLPEKKGHDSIVQLGVYDQATTEGKLHYQNEYGKRDGFNQALSQINHSLIADEVLKVVVEKITKDILDEIEQYIVSAKAIKINKQQADFVYWYDIKLAIKRLLSNLSPNKENKNNG